jgi:hypothetical protein
MDVGLLNCPASLKRMPLHPLPLSEVVQLWGGPTALQAIVGNARSAILLLPQVIIVGLAEESGLIFLLSTNTKLQP